MSSDLPILHFHYQGIMKIKDKLNEKQENAIELILQGMNDSQVAAQVGVSRQ